MANAQVGAKRVARFREVMAEKGYDAVVLRHNPDLRWLTDSERTFDFEDAHTAFITSDELYLHTDSRYFGTFKDRLGNDTSWTTSAMRHGRHGMWQLPVPVWWLSRIPLNWHFLTILNENLPIGAFLH